MTHCRIQRDVNLTAEFALPTGQSFIARVSGTIIETKEHALGGAGAAHTETRSNGAPRPLEATAE